jgi:hypothetical protein
MEKPEIVENDDNYVINYVLSGESRVVIINVEGGKSFQTVKFPAGTAIEIKISKLPIEIDKDDKVL